MNDNLANALADLVNVLTVCLWFCAGVAAAKLIVWGTKP